VRAWQMRRAFASVAPLRPAVQDGKMRAASRLTCMNRPWRLQAQHDPLSKYDAVSQLRLAAAFAVSTCELPTQDEGLSVHLPHRHRQRRF
jgi:hypothetical protein